MEYMLELRFCCFVDGTSATRVTSLYPFKFTGNDDVDDGETVAIRVLVVGTVTATSEGYRSSESWFLSAGLCIFCGWRSKGRIEKRAERKARVVEKQKQNKHYAAVSHTSILPPAFPVSSRRSTFVE